MKVASDKLQCTISPPLSLRVKVIYGLGEIVNAIKVVTFGLFSLFFATSVLGLPGTWVGVVGLLAMLWDAFIDPYIGYLTDGTQAQSRRYRFMLAGALTMGLGFWASFSPPANLSSPVLIGWLIAASLIVRTATSMFIIPYNALGVNLSKDYDERTSVMAIRGMTGTLGTLLTAGLSFVVFFPDKTPGVDPRLQHAGYASMGMTFGIVITVVALVALFGTPRTQLTPNSIRVQEQQAPGDFFRAMWASLRNRSFRIVLIASSLSTLALAVNISLLLHYLKFYVRIESSVALSSSQVAFFGAGLCGLFFWLAISRRFEKRRLYILSATATGALMVAALVLFGEGSVLGTGDIRPMLIGYGLAGFFNSILWFIPPSMLADVADEAELISGKRGEGALLGIYSFGQQVASGAAVMLGGTLLDVFVGLTPGNAPQTGVAVQRIAAVYSLVPAVLFLLAAVLMWRYSLTRERVVSIQDQLNSRRTMQSAAAAP